MASIFDNTNRVAARAPTTVTQQGLQAAVQSGQMTGAQAGAAARAAAGAPPMVSHTAALASQGKSTIAPAAAPKPAGGLFGALQQGLQKAVGSVAQAAQAGQQQVAAQRAAIDNVTPDTIDQQTGAARSLGAGIQGQGQAIQGQQAQLAHNLGGIAGTYRATAEDNRFASGTRATAGNLGSISNVSPGSLGGYGSVAGGLGAAPGAVSTGSLGGVGMAAGRLGAAPQVGSVGNIQTGSGPGAVAGTFGDAGVSSANQQSMLGRVNAFLDAPEGPSVAEAQLRQSQAQNMSQLLGAARSGRGGAGAQAQALAGAMSEGGAIASDTAGQLATLRAQEADMRQNRALSAMGLGGELATAARGQDLNVRAQDLAAAQGDQSAMLAGRGQDIQAAMANQQTQTQLEQLRANTALGARGQDLSAIQGDQSAQLGMRGQNLSALQGNQQTALGARGQDLSALSADVQAQIAARGQNLSALQGNQAAQVTARGQNVAQEGNILNANTTYRAQDLANATSNADRALAANQLSLQGQLGYRGLANDAQALGLNALATANQQALGAEGLAQDATTQQHGRMNALNLAHIQGQYGLTGVNNQIAAQPSFGQQMALAGVGALGNAAGGLLSKVSDERAKTDIAPLDAIAEHLRAAPGYRYRYKDGFGEDAEVEHAGPMAQDLEKSPFGKSLVRKGPDGYRRVDTARLTLVNHAALASMRSELDRLKAEIAA
jgi:hypothetical protein